jgi:hypothetical protein
MGSAEMTFSSETKSNFRAIEYASLRNETLLRIALQNLLLMLSTLIFAVSCIVMIASRTEAAVFAAAFCVCIAGVSAQWCHQGVRIMQLKQYMMLMEQSSQLDQTWESWLPANRPRTFLGSKWFISTKALLIGFQVSTIFLVTYIDASFSLVMIALSLLIVAGTSVLLLTNEKE